ncbi:CapA family protein [Parabacteroides sp. BX2]|uniref:CapA family protein n=1 Tax=Parabacteroides segnis TaxID=2763058 RepID=A0ABR7E390_9BACT|nr:CapA family protein [Parabacteroides segnis]MBC5643678.1 CapA family protein [Parabacteroides segnis]
MLKLTGDINFADGFFDTGFGVGSVIATGVNPYKSLKRSSDDFWIGNFECVCSDVSCLKGSHAKQFRISPAFLQHFQHFDLYNIANNHVMQHGSDAYREMQQNILSFGARYFGSNDKRSHTFEHQGKKISILGFSQRPGNFTTSPLYWAMPEYTEIAEQFKIIANDDFKIAYIHWGNEFINFPYNDQRLFAHWLIDLGFDLIVGMHPHVMQGFEVYKDKYIFYSLGNFVFNMSWEPTKYSVIVTVDLEGNIPCVGYEYVRLVDYFPKVVTDLEVPEPYRFTVLNNYLKQILENEIYYQKVFAGMAQYRMANRMDILKRMYKLSFNDFTSMFFDFIKRR